MKYLQFITKTCQFLFVLSASLVLLPQIAFAQSECAIGGCPQNCLGADVCGYGVEWRQTDCCSFPTCCEDGMTLVGSCCCSPTPIIIGLSGGDIKLTSARDGVMFDIGGLGKKVQVAWTKAGNDAAFLVLDRNHDGVINNGKELFGNATLQPSNTKARNGFLALAEYDKPENGGNADGVIDSNDAIFNSLRLWCDSDHNGQAQPEEILTLQSVGLKSISLSYSLSARSDEYGNLFKYKSKIETSPGSRIGALAWDVILTVARKP